MILPNSRNDQATLQERLLMNYAAKAVHGSARLRCPWGQERHFISVGIPQLSYEAGTKLSFTSVADNRLIWRNTEEIRLSSPMSFWTDLCLCTKWFSFCSKEKSLTYREEYIWWASTPLWYLHVTPEVILPLFCKVSPFNGSFPSSLKVSFIFLMPLTPRHLHPIILALFKTKPGP
jgi:hypothetical protein